MWKKQEERDESFTRRSDVTFTQLETMKLSTNRIKHHKEKGLATQVEDINTPEAIR